MRVLFVYRGIGDDLRNSVIDAQVEPLRKIGVEIVIFPIREGSLFGYLKAYFILRKFIIDHNIDLIHGHYSYSAIIASLASKKKTIASLTSSIFPVQEEILFIGKKFALEINFS